MCKIEDLGILLRDSCRVRDGTYLTIAAPIHATHSDALR